MSNPLVAPGPVPIEAQKQFPPVTVQFTATMNALSLAALYALSTYFPPVKTWSCMSIPLTSHGLTPINANFRFLSVPSGAMVKLLPALVALNIVSRGG